MSRGLLLAILLSASCVSRREGNGQDFVGLSPGKPLYTAAVIGDLDRDGVDDLAIGICFPPLDLELLGRGKVLLLSGIDRSVLGVVHAPVESLNFGHSIECFQGEGPDNSALILIGAYQQSGRECLYPALFMSKAIGLHHPQLGPEAELAMRDR